MEFLAPSMLWLLLGVPFLVLAYVLAQRRRRKYAVRFGSLLLLKQALRQGPGRRRHVPPAIYLVALIALIVALARPQTLMTLPGRDGTVVLLMDVSGSMQATDINPSRMEASKAAARAFIEKQPAGVRIGVVSFSDNATIIQSPTTNRDEVLRSIDGLRPQQATAIGRGLLASLDAIFLDDAGQSLLAPYLSPQQPSQGQAPHPVNLPTPKPALPTMTPVPEGEYIPAIVVLLTDGENNQFPMPLDIIDQVENRGVRVYTVGLGSPDGIVLSNQGRVMRTRLDEAMLERIAAETDGDYYAASSAHELRAIYEDLGMQMVMRTEKQEITWALAAIAINLWLIAGALSLLWFNRVL